ncbi:GNAT family N-acetyltransferase [Synechococcus sp. UW69]|uniref:GNAT family N-acetyltransferase n=1 Tax=Synechococcus sp. UW69 TaxID=368493 RepID=UPI000E0E9F68|nr:GNAT family N-acetyltransferase [Synechococcus sp. UW69]
MSFSLETPRLLIRSFSCADISETYLSWLNDRQLMRYSNQRFYTHTRESAINYIRSFSNSPNLFLAITLKSSEQLIGSLTIYKQPNHGTVNVGLLIGIDSTYGTGYGSEAWASVISFLKSDPHIRKICGGTLRPNLAMVRIMEKSGMSLESVRKHHELVDSIPYDLLHYSLFTSNKQ